MIQVVVGAPFAGKDRWIAAEIERRESEGEIGLLHLSYSGMYGAIVPGAESVYRDQRVTDSGAAPVRRVGARREHPRSGGPGNCRDTLLSTRHGAPWPHWRETLAGVHVVEVAR